MASIIENFNKVAAKVIIKKGLPMVQSLVEETPIDTGEARRGWKIVKTESGFRITNDVDYINELNEGSSQQAPSNFIEYTLMEFGKVRSR